MEHGLITREELARFDGKEGRKAYVAVNGKVYDVSASPRWQRGDHEGAHRAGGDLTEELKAAPHVRSVVERFQVVAHLAQEPERIESGPSGGWKLLVAAAAVVVVAVVVVWALFGR